MAEATDYEGAAKAMGRLFAGNPRSTGRWDPATGKATTEAREPTTDDFITHLKGGQGIGVVPILDNATCWWAAIDIDNHNDTSVDLPIEEIDQLASDNQLPLVMCRSKSGGIHAYLFLKEPLPATYVRTIMAAWAEILGHAGAEIFPKQSKLHRQATGGLSLGNWINLPYMSAANTIRYAVVNKVKLDLQNFIKYAESVRASIGDLSTPLLSQHRDAPPCIKAILTGAAQEGNRNEALFSTVVYLRRAFPDDFKRRAEGLNKLIFTKPLGKAELTRTIASAGRPDYSYRCGEEPLRSNCDKAACLKCKFGITDKEAENLELIQSLPVFTDLIKFISEPVRWAIKIDGNGVANLSTAQLLDWRYIRELVAEKMLRIVPMLKNNEWERLLQPLMQTARVVETPDDASVAGVVRLRLKEFAQRTDLSSKGRDINDRKALLRGLPVVVEMDGERCVVFRSQDFIGYLKRQKSEDLKGTNLWFAVRDLGVTHAKMRAGDHNINVWCIPVDTVVQDWAEAEAPIFKSDL